MKRLLLVDGNNLVMRYAAVPGLNKMSFSNEPTGGIHGAVLNILQDISTLKPDEVAIVFDGLGAAEKKRKIYAGYKASRGPMLDSMLGQIEATRNVLRAAGLFVFHEAGFDADDVIGTLAANFERSVLIKSNDKDFFQLVNNRISVLRPKMDVWDKRKVKRRIIAPKRFAEYLALCGDSVDGIPGLAGCGPVTALTLLAEYSWEELLKRPPIKWAAEIKAQRKDLEAFLRLTRIDCKCLSETHLRRIEPRLVPGKYSASLIPLLRSKNLRTLESWFKTHQHGVLSSSGTIFDVLHRSKKVK